MAGIVFGVVTQDPISGEKKFEADIDWDLGMASVIADVQGGKVVYAPRAQWKMVPDEVVQASLEKTKEATIESELKKMLDGGEQS